MFEVYALKYEDDDVPQYIVGPFASQEEARAWANVHVLSSWTWAVVERRSPKD